jgi:hypothetical protein
MKKALNKIDQKIYYVVDGVMRDGAPSSVWGNLTGVSGDLTDVWGNLTGVSGDLSGVTGNLSGVWGDLSGVTGNLSGVWGDLDDCELTPEDRERGVSVEELLALE